MTLTKPFAARAEYSRKAGDARSTPIRDDANLTNVSQQVYTVVSNWHEEAQEDMSRDEVLVVAFLFYGRIFPRSRPKCEAGALFFG